MSELVDGDNKGCFIVKEFVDFYKDLKKLSSIFQDLLIEIRW